MAALWFAALAAAVAQPAGEAPLDSQAGSATADPTEHVALEVPGPADHVGGGAVDLEIEEDKSELTFSYDWAGRTQIVRSDNPHYATVRQSTFGAELSIPIGGGDNLLTSETFDGLSDGPSLSLSFTQFRARSYDMFDRRLNSRIGAVIDRAVRECLAQVAAGTAPDMTEAGCRLGGDEPYRAFLERFGGLSIAGLNRLVMPRVWGWGIEGTVGYDRFEYRTPVTLAENSETEIQYSVRAYAVLFPSDAVSSLTVSARYERSYEARDDEILCPAVVANANEDCVSAPSGPPNSIEKLPLEIIYRRVLPRVDGLGTFAIAPRAGYDALNDEFEAEFALYLRPIRDIRILPGASITYNSRNDEVVVGLFLRQSFAF